jgi:tRNA nucleotidyltransferase (CCA-adding enzyme)
MCPVCKFRGWLQRCLKSNKLVRVKAMTDKKDRERVIAEITLSHLIRLGNEQGCPVSRQQALAFLNQEGRAFEMWKHMMQAAEEFIAGNLFQHSFNPEDTTDSRLGLGLGSRFAPPRASDIPCSLRRL